MGIETHAGGLDSLRSDMGPEAAAEIIQSLIQDAPSLVAKLEQAIAREDAKGLRIAAENVRSMCILTGAVSLAAELRALAVMSFDADLMASVTRRAAAVTDRYRQLVGELGDAANGLPGGPEFS